MRTVKNIFGFNLHFQWKFSGIYWKNMKVTCKCTLNKRRTSKNTHLSFKLHFLSQMLLKIYFANNRTLENILAKIQNPLLTGAALWKVVRASGFGKRRQFPSFTHSIPQNIHLYAANLRIGNSAKYFTHYALRNSAKYKYPTEIRTCDVLSSVWQWYARSVSNLPWYTVWIMIKYSVYNLQLLEQWKLLYGSNSPKINNFEIP